MILTGETCEVLKTSQVFWRTDPSWPLRWGSRYLSAKNEFARMPVHFCHHYAFFSRPKTNPLSENAWNPKLSGCHLLQNFLDRKRVTMVL